MCVFKYIITSDCTRYHICQKLFIFHENFYIFHFTYEIEYIMLLKLLIISIKINYHHIIIHPHNNF